MPAPPPALLAATFHRPAAPRHAVPRPALVARLNDGYGKTTLAAQLCRSVTWLVPDEAVVATLLLWAFAWILAAALLVTPDRANTTA